MTDKPPTYEVGDDGESLERLQQRFADLQAESLRVFRAMMKLEPTAGVDAAANAQQSALEVAALVAQRPDKILAAQSQFWSGVAEIWQSQTQPLAEENSSQDKRFRDAAWSENLIQSAIKQIYLLASDCVMGLAEDRDDLSEEDRSRIEFFSRQYIDALSPSNTVFGNPEVLRLTIESKGENLLKGLENLAADFERGGGRLAISRTVEGAFEVGRNLATTPGQIIFRNEVFELIEYAATTKEVFERPLLIIPPWINKYYILDLQAHNSFIRYVVGQGHRVFVVSWVNPTGKHRGYQLEDYMSDGVLTAIEQASTRCESAQVNLMGYCIGGTLSAAALAYLGTRGEAPVASATFLTTLTDFTRAGELKLFTTEREIAKVEAIVTEQGYLPAETMAEAFNLIRANDLVWSYVVNNYLKGKQPTAFDILHWNSDATRMPGGLHVEYLRALYQNNLLAQPGGLTLLETPIDLGAISAPSYMLSTEQDHIAPWLATYDGYQLWGGDKRFVLAESGHVAGVINPVDGDGFKPGKYGHLIFEGDQLPDNPEGWHALAQRRAETWWGDWAEWVAEHAGGKLSASPIIDGLYPAPGRYVVAP